MNGFNAVDVVAAMWLLIGLWRSWWLVNFAIIFMGGWSYIPPRIMILILMGIIIPGIIWHLTADIIRAYKHKLIEEIASASLASQAVGADKV